MKTILHIVVGIIIGAAMVLGYGVMVNKRKAEAEPEAAQQ